MAQAARGAGVRRAIILLAAMGVAFLSLSGVTPMEPGQATPPGTQSDADKLGFGFRADQAAGEDYVGGELIVGLKESETESLQGLEQAAAASNGRVEDKLKDPKNLALLLQYPSEMAARAA